MTTPNLGLSVTSQSSGSLISFLDWRLSQDGTSGSSNTGKIDTWAGQVSGSFAGVSGSLVSLKNDKLHNIIASGNGTVYTATNIEIASYFEGLKIFLTVDTTTTGTSTLNINSLGAKNLKKIIGATNLTLNAGDLTTGVYNVFIYSSGEFIWAGAQTQHWTYLTTPLTSTAWDGDIYPTTAKTLIDLSVVFGAPPNIKAGLFRVSVIDTSASSTDCYLILSPNNTAGEGMMIPCFPSSTRTNRAEVVVPCNTDGDIYYQILASGSLTFTASIQVWGYDK